MKVGLVIRDKCFGKEVYGGRMVAMIIGSTNVKGLRVSAKKRKMHELVNNLHLDFVVIQEVKLKEGKVLM